MKALVVNPHKLIPVALSLTLKASPPLGLAYVAAAIEAQGFDVTAYDCIAENPNNYFPFENSTDVSVLGIGFEDMFKQLEPHYDLIGVTVMFSNNWLVNRHLINLLKEHYPKALIVAGGEHMSSLPEYFLKDCKGLDMVVMGEGEETIAEVATLLRERKPYSNVAGTAYKVRHEKEDEIVVSQRRTRIREVNDIEPPAWHLFPLDKYFANDISYGITYGNSLPIFATRGCPYECTFCSSPQMWGTKYTMRDVENVIEEVKFLNSTYSVTNFDFYDLTAIVNKRWILDFCAAIKREGLKITWQIPAGTRSEAITYDVAMALKESGCKNITYAPESGSPDMLKAIKKKVVLPRMLNSIDQSHKAGLNVKLNIMMGYPDEKAIDILRTIWFLAKASYYGATDACPSIFNPYPGSALFNELVEKKELTLSDKYFRSIVFSESLHHFNNYNRNNGKAMMLTLLFLSYLVFYTSNYFFRPIRAVRLFVNVSTRNYETRGEYMLGEILKRRKAIKSA